MPGVPGDSFGAAAADYARHRKGFPPETLDRLEAHGIGLSGQHILDLGCGTGTIARQMAARGCTVVGLDVDSRMLVAADDMALADGVEVDWVEAPAEATGLPDGSFDSIVAGQSWHWFNQDEAITEVGRLLAPNARFAVCGFDWLPLPDTVPGATEALIEAYNPAWDLGGIRNYEPSLLPLLDRVDFKVVVTFRFDLDVVYAEPAWRRRIAASAGIVNLPPEEAAAFDRDLAEMLAERFPGPEVHTPHRVWAIVATPPAA
ncbi:MAG: methyltransferase domain-containing protein [Actinobacteria bacterium]|nr:methyltransferase domain-containing protein [Actinomycetota bacterium]MBT3686784.1 methyltransferase domain-containing protein [Actinomycetota bacterium]MBT4037121.1 methyltransferase domain-containing protein [Actinomycetota bacterium]MBT4278149.1 methyltransferase domain-containing protein [Actinomycetota bacterium]MBT4343793.1 methyltransferase domain-containing protein [Actinomycetota bacterium]